MEHVGIDLGRESQVAVITEAGELIEKRMRTEGDRRRLGHEVVVADPNYAPM